MSNKKIVYKPVSPEIIEIAEKYHFRPENLLEILKELDTLQKLNPETIGDVARSLNMPAHKVYGLATFYSMISFEKRRNTLRVCDGPVCWLKRGSDIDKAFLTSRVEGWTIERTSCLGLCDRAPSVLVNDQQAGPVLSPQDEQKLFSGWLGMPTDHSTPRQGETRVLMSLTGVIDPDSLEDAVNHGVYEGVKAALLLEPNQVIELLDASGLQGRGGAGFPVGRKWSFVAAEKRTPKYMVCNADESEPSIYKDRVLIDTNPHQLIAGMIIGAYACGASEGYIYIRGEYETQARRLERAILQAEEKNWLGSNIQGSDYQFRIHVHRGAGAYICGEETALLESLEGKRGEPRLRPPFPPQAGFKGLPTAVNNVETFCAVPHILTHGADWFKSFGKNPGTKIYMLLGHVKNPGLFEAPFDLTLRQMIDNFGGGMQDGSEFKFALTGGAAGTIVNRNFLDVPINYTSSQNGISLGAGAFLVCDQTVSPAALLRNLLHFFNVENCGKCTPCRVGTWRSLEILNQMTAGKGQSGNVGELSALAENMATASFCGLGQSVAIPMKSALQNFSEEFGRLELA